MELFAHSLVRLQGAAVPDRNPTIQRTAPPGKAGVRPKTPQNAKQEWHAVTIVTSGHACEAANLLKGHRYLSKQAPKLPLECCPAPEYCRCTYRHFTDRRAAGYRRGADRGEQISRRPTIGERRATRGRRSDDSDET